MQQQRVYLLSLVVLFFFPTFVFSQSKRTVPKLSEYWELPGPEQKKGDLKEETESDTKEQSVEFNSADEESPFENWQAEESEDHPWAEEGESVGFFGKTFNLWSAFKDDPSLGGKLRASYRLTYRGNFFKTGSFRFADPNQVIADDLTFARELEALHSKKRDQDFDQSLSISTKDLFYDGQSDSLFNGIESELSVRRYKDIDGVRDSELGIGILDRRSNGEDVQLRQLNMTVRAWEERVRLTMGRQTIHSAEWLQLDGARLRLRGIGFFGKPVEWEGFGGELVTFYRAPRRKEVYGGSFTYYPTNKTRLILSDVVFVRNTFQAELFQRVVDGLTLRSVYRQIDEDPESIHFDLLGQELFPGFEWRLSYHGKLGKRAEDFIFDFTYPEGGSSGEVDFAERLGISDLKPYDEVTLEIRQEIVQYLGAFIGGTGHWIRGGSSRDTFNTNWLEAWLGLDVLHFPWEGFTGRLTLRYLDTDLPRRTLRSEDDPFLFVDTIGDGDPDFLGLEFLIEQDFGRNLSIGSTFEYRNYTRDNRFLRLKGLDGYSLSGFFRYRPTSILSLSLAYTYEEDTPFFEGDLRSAHGVLAEAQIAW